MGFSRSARGLILPAKPGCLVQDMQQPCPGSCKGFWKQIPNSGASRACHDARYGALISRSVHSKAQSLGRNQSSAESTTCKAMQQCSASANTVHAAAQQLNDLVGRHHVQILDSRTGNRPPLVLMAAATTTAGEWDIITSCPSGFSPDVAADWSATVQGTLAPETVTAAIENG